MNLKQQIDLSRLPQHIAIIMDGNGRWAKKHGFQRIMGHHNGVKAVHNITEAAAEIGIKYLTLYTFSQENWNRPQEEIDGLMNLLVDTIAKETPTLQKNNVRLLTIGDINRLPDSARLKFIQCMEDTKQNTGLQLVIALSYSSRWEIIEACKAAAREAQPDQIDEAWVSQHLTTSHIPDPDLLIRTSGEYRISNFLLWQIAYAELYFTDTCWPDFNEDELYKAILDYQKRERRFGKTSEQLTK